MFIEDNDFIEIKIFCKKQSKNSYKVLTEKDYSLLKENKGYIQLNVKMKPLTWGLYNELNERAWVLDMASNERKLNFKVLKEQKLTSLIVSWDAERQTAEGKMAPVPVTKENIQKLAPEIAEGLLSQYDSISTLTEEEEKK